VIPLRKLTGRPDRVRCADHRSQSLQVGTSSGRHHHVVCALVSSLFDLVAQMGEGPENRQAPSDDTAVRGSVESRCAAVGQMGLSVSGPFVCRCLTGRIMLRFHAPLTEPDRRS